MTDTCPTCGSPVEVVSGDEGTHHYRPARPRVCDTWDCAGVPVAEFRWHEGHVGMQIGNYCESCLTALENGGWDGTTVRYPARVDPANVKRLRVVTDSMEEDDHSEWYFDSRRCRRPAPRPRCPRRSRRDVGMIHHEESRP